MLIYFAGISMSAKKGRPIEAANFFLLTVCPANLLHQVRKGELVWEVSELLSGFSKQNIIIS